MNSCTSSTVTYVDASLTQRRRVRVRGISQYETRTPRCWHSLGLLLCLLLSLTPVPAIEASNTTTFAPPITVLLTAPLGADREADWIAGHIARTLLAPREGPDYRVVVLQHQQRADDDVGTALTDEAYEPSALWDTLVDDHRHRVTFVRGDLIGNATLLPYVFATARPRWVCHVVGASSNATPALLVRQQVHSTLRMLEFSKDYNVSNFVLATTGGHVVYQELEEEAAQTNATVFWQEDAVAGTLRNDTRVAASAGSVLDRPLSFRAATTRMTELIAYTYHSLYGLPVTALRLFPSYGPGQIRKSALKESRRLVTSDSTIDQVIDISYVGDIANGVVRALEQPHGYAIINLGSGRATPVTELAKRMESVFDDEPDVINDHGSSPGPCCASISKAQHLLGYQPHTSWKEGLAKTREWYQTRSVKHRRISTKDADKTLVAAQIRPTPTRATTRTNLVAAPSDWERIPKVAPHNGTKTVLLTGAAGFIGSHVAEGLLARGDTVILVDEVNDYYDVRIKESNLQLLQETFGSARLRIYRGDLANASFISRVFAREKPEWVCHLAARAGVRPSIQNPYVYLNSNIVGTMRLLELSRIYNIQNFVFASSSSVYGGSQSTLFSEDERVDRPISPYAATKKSCELMAYTYHHLYGLPVTALRFFTVYGPRGRPDMAPFKFVDRVSRGLPLQQFGDGTSSRDYTYISDIVDGVVRAIDRPYDYQILNLGKGSGTQLIEFIELVQKYTGKNATIQYLPDQAGDVPYTCADVRKAEHFLGYKPKVSFEEGIRLTVEWFSKTYVPQQSVKKETKRSSPKTASKPSKGKAKGKAPANKAPIRNYPANFSGYMMPPGGVMPPEKKKYPLAGGYVVPPGAIDPDTNIGYAFGGSIDGATYKPTEVDSTSIFDFSVVNQQLKTVIQSNAEKIGIVALDMAYVQWLIIGFLVTCRIFLGHRVRICRNTGQSLHRA
jgi:UDP-glucuronate 4-epimerase